MTPRPILVHPEGFKVQIFKENVLKSSTQDLQCKHPQNLKSSYQGHSNPLSLFIRIAHATKMRGV